jgi:LmbE family N-acetylglucosaminyl deacetylase
VISCLALAEKNIDAIDLRHFTGSVKKYIEESKPDLVIVMYNVIGGDINYSTHKDKFDFR